ncbi:GNAT family N-acetyltransferase [Sporomusa malonica]|uniref:N-acetyltransferase domain-containing protein n=1 Tax=Sporomusa malonica TaxID=112901 RepID=A0A1W1YTF1_9FIRM|nr:GNAT family N-acetyltransferase [Sporomusa malonica]SMC39495.1 hypothetical protein SAMN04488500_102186 [Sporomusa malonica]
MEAIKIYWARTNQICDVQRFIDTYWRKGHILSRDAELLKWQYPFLEDNSLMSIVLAEINGEIAGLLGVIPCKFNTGDIVVQGGILALWLVRSEFRNQSVGRSMLDWVQGEGVKFIGVEGYNERTVGIYKRLQSYIAPTLPRLIGVIDGKACQEFLERNSSFQSHVVISKIINRQSSYDVSGYKSINWECGLSEKWDSFIKLQNIKGPIRDSAFIQWRYINHPKYKYEVRCVCDEDNNIHGIVVWRIISIKDSSDTIFRITEFLWDDAVAGRFLADFTINDAFQSDVLFADFYNLTGCKAEPFIERGFFVDKEVLFPKYFSPLDFTQRTIPSAFSLIGLTESQNVNYFTNPDIYLTIADGDQDRPS